MSTAETHFYLISWPQEIHDIKILDLGYKKIHGNYRMVKVLENKMTSFSVIL